MISIQKLVRAILVLIVVGAIFYLLYWLIGQLGLPEPFGWVARGVLLVGGVFALIGVLLDLIGYPLIKSKE